jgi:hypothetical protein
MKKVLLTLAAAAISLAASAQAEWSQNGYSHNFDGKDTTNCGIVIPSKLDSYAPSSKYSNLGQEYVVTNNGGGTLDIKVDGSQKGSAAWHKVFIQTSYSCELDSAINISNPANRKFKINLNSSDTVKQFLVMLCDINEFYADGNPVINTRLEKGDNSFSVNTIDFGIFGGTDKIDSTQIIGFGLYFRSAYNSTKALSDIKIDMVAIGDKVAGLSNEQVAALGLTFAPNPASDVLNVSYASQAGKNVVVTLSNGVSTVASTVGGDSSAEINVSNLASGLYYATVTVDGEYAATSKVLVK